MILCVGGVAFVLMMGITHKEIWPAKLAHIFIITVKNRPLKRPFFACNTKEYRP